MGEESEDVEETGDVDKDGDEEEEDEEDEEEEAVAFESFEEELFVFLFSLGDADLKRLERLRNEPLPNMSPALGCRAQ